MFGQFRSQLSAVEAEIMSDSIAHGLPRGSKSGIASPQTAQSTLAEALRSAGGIRDCAHREGVEDDRAGERARLLVLPAASQVTIWSSLDCLPWRAGERGVTE